MRTLSGWNFQVYLLILTVQLPAGTPLPGWLNLPLLKASINGWFGNLNPELVKITNPLKFLITPELLYHQPLNIQILGQPLTRLFKPLGMMVSVLPSMILLVCYWSIWIIVLLMVWFRLSQKDWSRSVILTLNTLLVVEVYTWFLKVRSWLIRLDFRRNQIEMYDSGRSTWPSQEVFIKDERKSMILLLICYFNT